MAQSLKITGQITNTSPRISQEHGANAVTLAIGDFELGALIDVDAVGETTVVIPGEFISNGPLSIIDETPAVDVVVGEFVEFGFATGVRVCKLTPGVPTVLEIESSISSHGTTWS